MVAAGVIRAGRAALEIGLDQTKLDKGLKGIRGRFARIGMHFAKIGAGASAVGAAIVAPLAAAVHKAASLGDMLGKMSGRTGVSVEALSTLRFAADQAGTSLETLEGGVSRMAKFMLNAEKGGKKYKDVLSQLGLTMDDLRGKAPEEQFRTIAARIAAIEDPTLRAGLAMQVFGESGRQMLPLLLSDIDALQQKARDMGLEWTAADVKDAEEFTDAVSRMRFGVEALTNKIGVALMPALTDLFDRIQPNVTVAIEWIKHNRSLVVTIAKVGAALMAIGAVLTGVGAAFGAISLAVAGIATVGLPMLAVAIAGVALIAFLGDVQGLTAALKHLFAQLAQFSEIHSNAMRSAQKENNKTIEQAREMEPGEQRDAFIAKHVGAGEDKVKQLEKLIARERDSLQKINENLEGEEQATAAAATAQKIRSFEALRDEHERYIESLQKIRDAEAAQQNVPVRENALKDLTSGLKSAASRVTDAMKGEGGLLGTLGSNLEAAGMSRGDRLMSALGGVFENAKKLAGDGASLASMVNPLRDGRDRELAESPSTSTVASFSSRNLAQMLGGRSTVEEHAKKQTQHLANIDNALSNPLPVILPVS